MRQERQTAPSGTRPTGVYSQNFRTTAWNGAAAPAAPAPDGMPAETPASGPAMADVMTADLVMADLVTADLATADAALPARVDDAMTVPAPPAAMVSPVLAARLAQAIVRPLAAAAGEVPPAGIGGLDGRAAAAMLALARHAGFAPRLNRAAAGLSGLGDIVFDGRALQRVGRSGASHCALFLATAAPALLERAALHLGAVVLHRQLLGFTLRREREALRRAVGEDNYRIATHEAPVLYAAFGDLDDGSCAITPAMLGDEAGERLAASAVTGIGRRTLHGFVARIEPPLAPLLAARQKLAEHQRFAEHPGFCAAGDVPAMTGRHVTHIASMLERRFGPWPPITG